jgi:hypothetical protein
MFLTLAPLSESFDMFIALAFCYIPPFIWLYFAYRSSKSGSRVAKKDPTVKGYTWVDSDENVPITKTGQFKMALLWFAFGSIFFWALLWPDHHDVWFIN